MRQRQCANGNAPTAMRQRQCANDLIRFVDIGSILSMINLLDRIGTIWAAPSAALATASSPVRFLGYAFERFATLLLVDEASRLYTTLRPVPINGILDLSSVIY
jgi:hypothetical protein